MQQAGAPRPLLMRGRAVLNSMAQQRSSADGRFASVRCIGAGESRSTLIAALLVDEVLELLALPRDEEPEVREEELLRAGHVLGIGSRAVRRDQKARQAPEHAVLRQGLLLEDVERRAPDRALPEGLDQGLLVDLLAAAHVD